MHLRNSNCTSATTARAVINTERVRRLQKHVRDAALCDDRAPSPFWSVSTSKTFTKVPMPFCNDAGLRSKLARAIHWHQGLLCAMLTAARGDAALAPLVRAHVRGVYYGVARQVQQYVEKLAVLCDKGAFGSGDIGGRDVMEASLEGLFQWLQMYCRLWMYGFEVRCMRFGNGVLRFNSTMQKRSLHNVSQQANQSQVCTFHGFVCAKPCWASQCTSCI